MSQQKDPGFSGRYREHILSCSHQISILISVPVKQYAKCFRILLNMEVSNRGTLNHRPLCIEKSAVFIGRPTINSYPMTILTCHYRFEDITERSGRSSRVSYRPWSWTNHISRLEMDPNDLIELSLSWSSRCWLDGKTSIWWTVFPMERNARHT